LSYWDAAAELKPLLHTWSLGVEEQFYLFWPALVVGLVAIRRRIEFATAVSVVAVVGVAITLWFSTIDLSAAFYLFPFRIFQFAAGAAVASILEAPALRHFRSDVIRDAIAALGLSILAACIVGYSADIAFPGVWALPPTFGAMLVIVAGGMSGGHGRATKRLLENRAALWLGKVSYSMYLVHWAIVALWR
jgi:peptidoglycan/LPS O-acetylase OafA/YrhL